MRRTLLLGTAMLTLFVARAGAQQVSYDYNRSVDFTRFRTYAWAAAAPTGDAITDQRIVAAIDSQLAASGLLRAQPGADPDLTVSTSAGIGRSLEVRGSSSGWAGGARWGSARTSEVYTGALGIQLQDATTGVPVWHGVVSRELDPRASPEQRERNLNKAIAKLFKHYPTRERQG